MKKVIIIYLILFIPILLTLNCNKGIKSFQDTQKIRYKINYQKTGSDKYNRTLILYDTAGNVKAENNLSEIKWKKKPKNVIKYVEKKKKRAFPLYVNPKFTIMNEDSSIGFIYFEDTSKNFLTYYDSIPEKILDFFQRVSFNNYTCFGFNSTSIKNKYTIVTLTLITQNLELHNKVVALLTVFAIINGEAMIINFLADDIDLNDLPIANNFFNIYIKNRFKISEHVYEIPIYSGKLNVRSHK